MSRYELPHWILSKKIAGIAEYKKYLNIEYFKKWICNFVTVTNGKLTEQGITEILTLFNCRIYDLPSLNVCKLIDHLNAQISKAGGG